MSVNKVILVGRVGANPELKSLQNDGKVVNFSLATSEYSKDKDGNKKEKTEWHNIVAWAQLAENVSKFVVKGSQVYVEGKITNRSWDATDGTKKYITEIVASQVVFLDSKKTTENAGATSTPATTTAKTAAPAATGKGKATQPAAITTGNDDDNDDLPF
jgi:single-strand DNA-binding protein